MRHTVLFGGIGLVLCVSGGCGDSLSVEAGDGFRLEVTSRELYDCSPGGAGAVDHALCGTLSDTIELDNHWRLLGQFVATDVILTPVPGTHGAVVNEAITVEGEVEETTCDPTCAVTFQGSRTGSLQRLPMPCGLAPAASCDGREDETVIVVFLQMDISIPTGQFTAARFLGGVEDSRGNLALEFLTPFGTVEDSLIVPRRHGHRVAFSMIRD